MTYREFTDAVKGLCEHMTTLIKDDRAFMPMVHLLTPVGVESIGLEPAWFDESANTEHLPEMVVLPLAEAMGATAVAWTFVALVGKRAVDHEAAIATIIDGERHEVHEARLWRFGGRAHLGAWQRWTPNEQEGRLITPIQKALR